MQSRPILLMILYALLVVTAGCAAQNQTQRIQGDRFRVSRWVRKLRSAQEEDRIKAAKALGDMREGARSARSHLRIALYSDRSEHVREHALRALFAMGQHGFPAWLYGLQSPHTHIRNLTEHHLEERAQALTPQLAKLLRSPIEDERQQAVLALSKLSPKHLEARLALVNVFSTTNSHLKIFVAKKMQQHPKVVYKTVVPQLTQALHRHRDDAWVRAPLMRLLAKLGPHAAPAIPTLLSLVKEEDKTLRRTALKTLEQIGSKGAKALGQTLKNLPWWSHYDTYKTLARMQVLA
ncbi:MAG: HEAT repeat domain-containing protein, partial [Myxococcota bacterium]